MGAAVRSSYVGFATPSSSIIKNEAERMKMEEIYS